MKRIVFCMLITISTSVPCAVKNPDGSVTITKEEALKLNIEFERMVDQGSRQSDEIKKLREQLEALLKGKCV